MSIQSHRILEIDLRPRGQTHEVVLVTLINGYTSVQIANSLLPHFPLASGDP